MTTNYKNILLAVDLDPDCSAVIETASSMAKRHEAKLNILHVIEPLHPALSEYEVRWGNRIEDFEVTVREAAEKRLKELATELGIAEADCHLLEGRPGPEIHAFCKEHAVDLVVIGTHGQHGLQLVLGSTANSVLHGSPCDVLAVRLKQDSD